MFTVWQLILTPRFIKHVQVVIWHVQQKIILNVMPISLIQNNHCESEYEFEIEFKIEYEIKFEVKSEFKIEF